MPKISEVEVTIAGRNIKLNRVQLICNDPSLTQQNFTKTTDIKTILAKYAKTGILGDPTRKPIFGDFSRTDYETKLNDVANIKSQFEHLPAKTRERFNNNAGEMLDFLSDTKNDSEAVKLGLKDKSVLPPQVKKPEDPPPAEK